MASRGKKKAVQTNIALAQNVQNEELTNKNLAKQKLDVLLNTTIVLVLLFSMILILGAPVVGVVVKVDASSLSQEQEEIISDGNEDDVINIDVNASMLLILIAPTHGTTSGFDFVLENAENIPQNKVAYTIYSQLARYLIGEEKLNDFQSLSVFIYILSAVITVSFVVTIITACIDRLKKKKSIIATLVSSSVLEASVLIMLITLITTMIQGMTSKMSIIPTWGIWVAFFALTVMLIVEIYYVISKKKICTKRENIKDEKMS